MSEDAFSAAMKGAAEAAGHAATTGNGITGVSASWAVWSGLTLNEWGVIVGIGGVVVGTLITYIYKRLEVGLKREMALKELALMQEKAERERMEFEARMLKEHGPNWRASSGGGVVCAKVAA
jgi:hypothetical protein